MLLETQVINAVCDMLESREYKIQQRLETTQHGDDIIATKQMRILRQVHIEAKGATSSRKGSERFAKEFDSAQIRIHVAEALYKVSEILSRDYKNVDMCVGIAMPDNEGHRSVVKKVEPILKQLGIAVFWVDEKGNVKIDSIWTL